MPSNIKQPSIHNTWRNTYRDTLVIEIPCNCEGVIKGEDIPVAKGYYKYKGSLIIKNKRLNVSLLIDDTDDKKLRPDTWNGSYRLEKD